MFTKLKTRGNLTTCSSKDSAPFERKAHEVVTSTTLLFNGQHSKEKFYSTRARIRACAKDVFLRI